MQQLQLREGSKIEKSANGLIAPRMLAVADDGTIYIMRTEAGDVMMLRDASGNGKADEQKVIARRPAAPSPIG